MNNTLSKDLHDLKSTSGRKETNCKYKEEHTVKAQEAANQQTPGGLNGFTINFPKSWDYNRVRDWVKQRLAAPSVNEEPSTFRIRTNMSKYHWIVWSESDNAWRVTFNRLVNIFVD